MKKLIIMFLLLISVFTIDVLAEEETYLVDVKSFKLYNQNNEDVQFNLPQVVTKDRLEMLQDMGVVNYYEPNYEVKLFSNNWNLNIIKSDFAGTLGCYGNEIRVGVIDSGITVFNSIKNNVLTGKNIFDDSTNTTDNKGHGTYVAGIIASHLYGTATNCKLVPIKCFDPKKTTYLSDIIKAIKCAVDDFDCKVINMSFGMDSRDSSLLLKNVIDYAENKGAILVAAAGNDGNSAKMYPASYSNVVSVGSVGKTSLHSSFSQHNDAITVVAPGESISSLAISGYTDKSGTSFSAPHVTALAAIALNIKDMNSSEFKELLKTTCDDLGDEGYDTYYGYGLINFKKTLLELIKDKDIFVSPTLKGTDTNSITIYNNSKNDKNAVIISKGYNDSETYILSSKSALINPNTSNIFTFGKGTYKDEYYIWDSITNLMPITKIRIIS